VEEKINNHRSIQAQRRKENHQPGTIDKGIQLGKHPSFIIHAKTIRALGSIGLLTPK
jgi:hypothetical protein